VTAQVTADAAPSRLRELASPLRHGTGRPVHSTAGDNVASTATAGLRGIIGVSGPVASDYVAENASDALQRLDHIVAGDMGGEAGMTDRVLLRVRAIHRRKAHRARSAPGLVPDQGCAKC
jgi:hypothetical protein